MSIVANAGQIIGEFLGLSVAKSMGQLDVVNNDKNDGKISFLPKEAREIYLKSEKDNGSFMAEVLVNSCVLDSDPEAKVPFCCFGNNFKFGTIQQFVDATKIKIVLAALGENIGPDFIKGHFKDIKAFKAKLEGKPVNK